MSVTRRRFWTVVLAVSGLIFIVALAALITAPLPSGRSASIGTPVHPRVRPRAVAPHPAGAGGTVSVPPPRIPGGTAAIRRVHGPQALAGPAAAAARVRGSQARPAGRSTGGGVVPAPQAALSGGTAGPAVLGPPAIPPADAAAGTAGAVGDAVTQPEPAPTGRAEGGDGDQGSADHHRHHHHGDSHRRDPKERREHRGDGRSRPEDPSGSAEQAPTASPEPGADTDRKTPDQDTQSN